MRLADKQGIVVIDKNYCCWAVPNFSPDLNMMSGPDEEKRTVWEICDTTKAHEQVIRELIDRDKNLACAMVM